MKIGHTGITWGIPGDPKTAYRDTAELGFQGFETFGHTILGMDFKPLVAEHGIPVTAAYCTRIWIETPSEDVESAKPEADALKALGGETFVLATGRRPEGGFTDDQFDRLANGLEAISAYCNSIGLATGLHPHTGTSVESGDDIDAVMSRVHLTGFAPDSGQIAKGGTDPLPVLQRYRDRTTHVHLKDWNGYAGPDDRSGYANYEPVGSGVLPMNEILELYRDFDGWVNVELDGMGPPPRPPREAARMSRDFLKKGRWL